MKDIHKEYIEYMGDRIYSEVVESSRDKGIWINKFLRFQDDMMGCMSDQMREYRMELFSREYNDWCHERFIQKVEVLARRREVALGIQ